MTEIAEDRETWVCHSEQTAYVDACTVAASFSLNRSRRIDHVTQRHGTREIHDRATDGTIGSVKIATSMMSCGSSAISW